MTVPSEELWRAAWVERPRLLTIARRRSRCQADAEEIVSEAMLRCVTHPALRPGQLPGLLTAVVMRLCVDRLRDRVTAELNAPRLHEPPPDALGDVLDRAEAAWLTAEIARLTDNERGALTARMLGLSVAETAEALGVSYKAAESALGRAKGKLRALWARTLGVLLPRKYGKRRARVMRNLWTGGPLLAAAVFGAATLTFAHPDHRAPVRELPAPSAVYSTPVRRAAVRGVLASRAPTVVGVESEAPQGAGTRLATPDLSAGPVHKHPATVTINTDPIGRLQHCARSGVQIDLGPRYGVTCRDE